MSTAALTTRGHDVRTKGNPPMIAKLSHQTAVELAPDDAFAGMDSEPTVDSDADVGLGFGQQRVCTCEPSASESNACEPTRSGRVRLRAVAAESLASRWAARRHDPTAIRPVDLDAAEVAARDLLVALGEDPEREGLRDTPRRVAKAMAELMSGRFIDPETVLARQFTQDSDEVVMLRDIEFHSLCEHHLLPFTGRAHIAYLPGNGKVVGLSKLARLLDLYARRPQIQEQLTQQVADALDVVLGAKGVAVIIAAEHMCMKMRGVGKQQSVMHTMALRGVFRDQPAMRSEVISLLTNNGLSASHSTL